MHDHLINAIGLRKISCLCFLDLLAISTSLTTISFSLICPLATFTVLFKSQNWFRSYLSSRFFRVKCNNNFSSLHTCLCGVPQGSVFGRPLFIVYTTPLSSLISSLSLNHRFHADDTQLFLSFHLSNFHSNITYL